MRWLVSHPVAEAPRLLARDAAGGPGSSGETGGAELKALSTLGFCCFPTEEDVLVEA